MASKENGESPPIVILSSFIGDINNDKSDPCNPRMSHLEQKYYRFINILRQCLFIDMVFKLTLLSYLNKINYLWDLLYLVWYAKAPQYDNLHQANEDLVLLLLSHI